MKPGKASDEGIVRLLERVSRITRMRMQTYIRVIGVIRDSVGLRILDLISSRLGIRRSLGASLELEHFFGVLVQDFSLHLLIRGEATDRIECAGRETNRRPAGR